MIYPLIVTVLSPLLLMQGLYVRKITPRLPEPLGEREGEKGSGATLRLLILGDSAAAGVGVSQQSEALSGQLMNQLSADYHLTWQLWAKNGQGSNEIIHLLKQQKQKTYDVVLISIGVNDVTGGLSLKKWLSQSNQIVELLKTKFLAQHIIFTALPPMHLFPALPQPLRWVLGFRAKQFNLALKEITENITYCQYLSIDAPKHKDYIATDGFHPSSKTYTLWATEAVMAINEALELR